MRKRHIRTIYFTAIVFSAILFGSQSEAFAQGKGRGNGTGGGNGRGGGPAQVDRPQGGGWERRSAQQPQQRQQWGGQMQRPQQQQREWRQPKAQQREWRQPQQDNRRQQWEQMRQQQAQQRQQLQQVRGWQQRSEQQPRRQEHPQQRVWQDRGIERRQQRIDDMNARRRQEETWDQQAQRERRQTPEWIERRGGDYRVRDDRRVNDEGSYRRDRRDRYERGNLPGLWDGGRDNSYLGYKNYGQYRSAQVHERNALRKASRGYDGRYYGYNYDDPEYRYDVIRNIVHDRVYYDHSYSPSYVNYYYGSPYYDHYGSPYNYAYYGSPYSSWYAPSVTYVYVPQYGQVYYEPYYASYGYPNYYGSYYPSYSNYGYYDTGNAYYGDPYYRGSGLGTLIYKLSGNSFIGRLLSSFLTQGYDEGYLAGLYARDHGYYDDPYYDPYGYNETLYNAYSTNLSENRRIFSEGYEAGYRDAMSARRNEYDPYYDRRPDLVSLLIGNSLSGI